MRETASRDEAAAVVAAVARFEAETARQEGSPPQVDPWQRAALIEGVSAKGTVQDLEGGVRWLS